MGCWQPIALKSTGEIVPCGRCVGCLERRRAEWSFRLFQELKVCTSSHFITLTLKNEDNTEKKDLSKKELQKYFKRVRSVNKDIKYYAVGEYGGQTYRPHYHAIIYNANPDTLNEKWISDRGTESAERGFVKIGEVTEASIHYVTGYIINKSGNFNEINGREIKNPILAERIKPFSLMSKGLGKIYLKHSEKFLKSNLTNIVFKEGGKKQLLPRYYKEKLFDKEEKIIIAEKNKNLFKQLSPAEFWDYKQAKLNKLKTKKKYENF